MKYEPLSQPLLSRAMFLRRLVLHGGYAAVVVAASLALGVAGYHWIAHFGWVDSLLNASMLLGGMGPVGELCTTSAKLFASAFALYAGLVFVVVAGFLLAPMFHRVLHRFHWEAGRLKG